MKYTITALILLIIGAVSSFAVSYGTLYTDIYNPEQLWFTVYDDIQHESFLVCYTPAGFNSVTYLQGELPAINEKTIQQCQFLFFPDGVVAVVPNSDGLGLWYIQKSDQTVQKIPYIGSVLTAVSSYPKSDVYIYGATGNGSIVRINVHDGTAENVYTFPKHTSLPAMSITALAADPFYHDTVWVIANNDVFYVHKDDAVRVVLPDALHKDIINTHNVSILPDPRKKRVLWIGGWRINKKRILGIPKYYINKKNAFRNILPMVNDAHISFDSIKKCMIYDGYILKKNSVSYCRYMPNNAHSASAVHVGHYIFMVIKPQPKIALRSLLLCYDIRHNAYGMYNPDYDVVWSGISINDRIQAVRSLLAPRRDCALGELYILIGLNNDTEKKQLLFDALQNGSRIIQGYTTFALMQCMTQSDDERLIALFNGTTSLSTRACISVLFKTLDTPAVREWYRRVMNSSGFPLSTELNPVHLFVEEEIVVGALRHYADDPIILQGFLNYYVRRFSKTESVPGNVVKKAFRVFFEKQPELWIKGYQQIASPALRYFMLKAIADSHNRSVEELLWQEVISGDAGIRVWALEMLGKRLSKRLINHHKNIIQKSYTSDAIVFEDIDGFITPLAHYPLQHVKAIYTMLLKLDSSYIRAQVYTAMQGQADKKWVQKKYCEMLALEKDQHALYALLKGLHNASGKRIDTIFQQVLVQSHDSDILNLCIEYCIMHWNSNIEDILNNQHSPMLASSVQERRMAAVKLYVRYKARFVLQDIIHYKSIHAVSFNDWFNVLLLENPATQGLENDEQVRMYCEGIFNQILYEFTYRYNPILMSH